jgi:nitrite reductase/ring-hydroxylating ferredoxin subunit
VQFVKIAKVTDFEIIKIKSYSMLGRKVGVIKRADGSFYAIEVACKHQGADLTNGTIKNGIATCPRHGWQYDLETGECLNEVSSNLRHHELKIEDGVILVSLHPMRQ